MLFSVMKFIFNKWKKMQYIVSKMNMNDLATMGKAQCKFSSQKMSQKWAKNVKLGTW